MQGRNLVGQYAGKHDSTKSTTGLCKKLEEQALPEYRRLAANLIEHFIKEFKTQGGDDAKIREHFERMYKWKQ